MISPVMRLREALEPELASLIVRSRGVIPGLDGASIGSLITLYGVEVALGEGRVGRVDLAGYLRLVAEALEEGACSLPTLSRGDFATPATDT